MNNASQQELLIRQISQVAPVADETLAELQREILSIKQEWTRVYSDYYSGGWLTLSLLNSSSNTTDTTIRDCVPVETELLAGLPHTKAFLKSLSLNFMWVRLAKLEPNTMFWEHRDYQELVRRERLRLHVPIITNEKAALIVEGLKVHLERGYIWKLNPTHRHGASNFGSEARIHILMDCYADSTLNNLVTSEVLDKSCIERLPVPSDAELTEAADAAEQLAHAGDFAGAENLLLKLFHTYSVEDGVGYDLISQMYVKLGDEETARIWRDRKNRFLYTG